jgi:hypothetical protein
MIIHSPFKDYYDTAAATGVDTSIVYNRTVQKTQIDKAFYADMPNCFFDKNKEIHEDTSLIRSYKNEDIQYGVFKIIGFCGKTYVGLFDTKVGANDIQEAHNLAYFGADLLNFNWRKERLRKQASPQTMIENCLLQYHNKQDDTLFKQFNAPIFEVDIRHTLSRFELKNKGLYLPTFTINTPLSIFQFYKIFDPFSAFQAIQSYVSGVLGTDVKPMIEVSNTIKIVKAGFDLKTSFRKDKKI